MKKLFEAADRYIQSSDWKVISVLKFCLISLGMIVGMLIKPEHKKVTMVCAIAVFMASKRGRTALWDPQCVPGWQRKKTTG